ncbi:MAG: hypothetical protein B7Y15_04400 [Bacteroidetes bacterium 24-39-8]|jgi:hypothetical protein|nr:MAG: hypothetical protein B7Y15_04400 [Bacteroidetes bacterium 24-39-8]OZA63602.1 MAG: hypothetical protein B7X72_10145 [Sphingobacteriia bacterium 39-39-8]HQR94116.1 YceI family protein [Sediminibacterium sp.]HQS56262.1 YceI family protein [Sediminibacterium sp.]
MIKWIVYLAVYVLVSGYYPAEPAATWVVMQGSSLTVNGSTNVSKFQCDITDYSLPDTITCAKAAKSQTLPMSGKLKLDIEAFDCHNRMMTSDLRKTLKYKEFPKLIIKFISINSYPNFKNPTKITGAVDISLAGIVKRYDISYVFTVDNSNIVHLKGHRAVTFTDFNLNPPSKLGGVIKAKDELLVEFKLNLKPLS